MAEQAPSIEQRISGMLAAEEAPPPDDTPEPPKEARAEAPTEQAPADAGASASEDEGVEITTLAELAEALGADVADLYNIKLPIDIDGQGKKEVTLGQWKDTYRDTEILTKQRQELDAKRAEIETLHKQKVEALDIKEREAADLLNYMEQQLLSQYGGVDWNHLRQSDPGQWAALSFQFEQEKQRLAQLRSTAALKWDNAKRELSQAEEARNREIAAQEMQQMMDAIPEWKDPTKYEHETSQLKAFLLNRGFTPDDIQGIRLRQVLLARDAMRYQEMTKQANVVKNKVFKLGKKVLTSGARAAPNEQASARETSLKSALKKSGHYKDAAALISERMKG